jgi:hypothetical protein
MSVLVCLEPRDSFARRLRHPKRAIVSEGNKRAFVRGKKVENGDLSAAQRCALLVWLQSA